MRFGMGELVVILLIAIVIFGSGKIIRLGEDVGKAVKSFRKGLNTDESEPEAEKKNKDKAKAKPKAKKKK
jgi:sec-independent protein translocase protein TatA